ncbi:hypothetical protein QMT40_002060 [Parvibaculaceae bacterium PLY_AMNH_Bact1]|nr:hypothetical protein QMT40_002060 [Parvibaculaceae bacterium PLY_AMNH_Bact1]
MTAFVAKMLTLLGVVLYAGGPIDAVTLIVQGENVPQSREVLVEHIAPGPQLSAFHAVAAGHRVVAGTDLFVDNEVQNSAVSVMEVGLRSGIGFEQ